MGIFIKEEELNEICTTEKKNTTGDQDVKLNKKKKRKRDED